MNRVFLILMVAVFFTACNNEQSDKKSKDVEVIDNYANGAVRIEHDMKDVDGKRVAVYEREFYKEGGLLKEGPLGVKEKRNGLWKSYYRDGVLWSEGEYKNGVRDGKTVTYFSNGKKYYEGQFVKAQKSGLWKFYNEKGEFVNETIYDPKKKAAITIDK